MARRKPAILIADPRRIRRQALVRLFQAAGLHATGTDMTAGWLKRHRPAKPGLIIARVRSASRRELGWIETSRAVRATAGIPVWLLAPSSAIAAIRAQAGPGEIVTRAPVEPEQIVAQARAMLAGKADSARTGLTRERLLQMEVHDLKTPLANIINLSDLLLTGEMEPERRDEFITSISDNARIMLKLVMNLLNVAALESGRLALTRQPVAPAEIVHAAIAQVGWLLRRKRMRVRAELAAGLPMVPVDRELLVRLAVNLIDNAAHYGRAEEELEFTASAEGAGVRFDVLDRGPGIPPGLRDRIFEPYVQVEGGGQHSYSTGLGLTFCRLVTAAHGGRIWVEERPGGGSRFSVWIPAATRHRIPG